MLSNESLMPFLSEHLWFVITSFGGAGLTLPLAFAIALWLAFGYSWRLAAGWLLLLGVAVALVTATKIAFLGWGVGVRAWDFTGLSGHSMFATAVFPVAAFLVLLPAPPAVRLAGVAAGLLAGALISFSRIVIEAHSPSEAVTGCIVGAMAALAFIRIAWDATPGRLLPVMPVVLSLMVLTLGLHNLHVPTHRWVTHIALKVSGHVRPFAREPWRALHDTGAPFSPTAPTAPIAPIPPAAPAAPLAPVQKTRNVALPVSGSDA
jgi:membrane-associated phospholipid phosphatase